MLLLRILALPIAMFSFAVLHTLAIKAPHMVDLGSLVLLSVLPLFGVMAGVRRILHITTKG